MRKKIYAIFLIKNNSDIVGINFNNYNLSNFTMYLSYNKATYFYETEKIDIILKKAKLYFPKLLKNGSKLVPIRLTKKFYSLPIKINNMNYIINNKYYSNSVRFKRLNKVELRKRKLKKLSYVINKQK